MCVSVQLSIAKINKKIIIISNNQQSKQTNNNTRNSQNEENFTQPQTAMVAWQTVYLVSVSSFFCNFWTNKFKNEGDLKCINLFLNELVRLIWMGFRWFFFILSTRNSSFCEHLFFFLGFAWLSWFAMWVLLFLLLFGLCSACWFENHYFTSVCGRCRCRRCHHRCCWCCHHRASHSNQRPKTSPG